MTRYHLLSWCRTGTYVLDGYSIELRYDSGAVEHHLFGISTDPGHAFLPAATPS